MLGSIARYERWLHGRWPAGRVERLPAVTEDGRTNVPGLFVVGDLKGVSLLKFAVDSGARAAALVADEIGTRADQGDPDAVLDLVIIGAGVAGISAAVEARRRGLRFVVLEASRPFATVANFPARKPIFTYPTDMTPDGSLTVSADVKEDLLAELRSQAAAVEDAIVPGRVMAARRSRGTFEVQIDGREPVRARRVIAALGRSGDHRLLGVPGEDLPHVSNRLHDPKDHAGSQVLVVGGGDSAVEAAVALARCGSHVTLVHRGAELTRPKPKNLARLHALEGSPDADVSVDSPTSERVTTAAGPFLGQTRRPGSLKLRLGTRVKAIGDGHVDLDSDDGPIGLSCSAVFVMIGRDPPLGFFRRSGVRIRGEWRASTWVGLAAFLAVAWAYYDLKSGGVLDALFRVRGWFPYGLAEWWPSGMATESAGTLAGVVARSAQYPGFWATAIYSLVISVFGIRRIRRRRTPYVTVQTLVLMGIQVLPLFLLPEILLPWADARGWIPEAAADALFPRVAYGNGREYWRAYGLILAWPLNVYNVLTPRPLGAWLGISIVQTFVVIPLLIRVHGKGAYCGWICSCGALAETLGDAHRDKMPHGPGWNRLNMLGQGILAVSLVLLGLRVAGWAAGPDAAVGRLVDATLLPLYKWSVDVTLAGVLGVGLYFWFSGRTWCRFACPLAALMHVYARFSRFAIVPDKARCISCNACTATCHQGIDVMSFANKGLPMQDPQCVRCSACVQACPTGVLAFGRVDRQGATVSLDALAASAVRAREAARP